MIIPGIEGNGFEVAIGLRYSSAMTAKKVYRGLFVQNRAAGGRQTDIKQCWTDTPTSTHRCVQRQEAIRLRQALPAFQEAGSEIFNTIQKKFIPSRRSVTFQLISIG